MSHCYSSKSIRKKVVGMLINNTVDRVTIEYVNGTVYRTSQPQELDYQLDISHREVTMITIHDGQHTTVFDRQGRGFYQVL